MAARSQSIQTTTPLRAFVRRAAGRGSPRLSRPPKPAIQIRQGGGHCPALLRAQPPNARKPDGKLIGLHRIKLLKPPPSLVYINSYRYKRQKVALISSDNPYSKTIYEGLNKSFKAAGWTVTDAELVPFGEVNDWHAFLAKVRQDPPDVLINTDYLPANAATFMSQFMERLWCKRFEVEPSRRRDVALDHAARTAFQILGAVLPLVPSLPSLN